MLMEAFFDFEKPIVNLERKLQDLRDLAKQEGVDFTNEINILEKKVVLLIIVVQIHQDLIQYDTAHNVKVYNVVGRRKIN